MLRLRSRRPRRAPSRVVVGGLALSMCVAALPLGRAGAGDGPTADQVADQIIAVQDRADAAAGQWTNLDDEARDIAGEVAATEVEVVAATATYDSLQRALAEIAMNRYTGQLPQFIPFTDSPMRNVETDALTGFALGTGAVDLDQFGAARRDLARKQAQLDDVHDRNAEAIVRVQTKRDELDAQITQLSALEGQLRDAEVERSYAAKLAARRQREADAAVARDAAAAQASAAATASATVGGARGGGASAASAAPATTVSRTPPPAAGTPAPASSPTSTAQPPTPSSTAGSTSARPSSTTSEPERSPATEEPARSTATSATTEPPAAAGASPSSSGLVCPVAGTVAFGDTWGAARSGGRRHEGVDMISPFGTPVVAVDEGVATMKTTSLGGNSVGLHAADGTYYFYAHLSSWEGSSRAVRAGEVIGHVGHTGDTTVDHLHFEVHPGGGDAVNPYPTVRRIC